jgi:hypothetical protein
MARWDMPECLLHDPIPLAANARTAKMLGITVPPTLARGWEVG